MAAPVTVSREISSAAGGVAVTASDTTVYTTPSRAVYVGAAGNMVVRMAGQQNNLTFVGIQAGTVLPLCVDMVLSTNTTASSIVLLW